jgi:hypothetical protein
MKFGAIALVNTGLGRESSIDARYVAVGAAARLPEIEASEMCYEANELVDGSPARRVYESRIGLSAGSSSVVCLGLPRMKRAVRDVRNWNGRLGLLGDVFHSRSLRTAVIGNSDVFEEKIRRAPVIAMDSNGLVDSGTVSSLCVKKDFTSPCGVSDDIGVISRLVCKYIESHGLTVVELGDLNRCESERTQLTNEAYAFHRRKALGKLDSFIGNILPEVHRVGAVLVVYSPCRYAEELGEKSSNLTPIIVVEPKSRPGLLISNTTRTVGLISNTDIGPTILKLAGLNPPVLAAGSPAMIVETDRTLSILQRMERVVVRNYRQRVPFLLVVGIFAILSATICELMLSVGSERRRFATIFSGIYLTLLAMPASLLLANWLDIGGFSHILAIFGFNIGIVLSCWVLTKVVFRSSTKHVHLPATICIFTSLLVVIDGITGFRLLRYSMLTCDQIVGMRYYGLGNEYMGILVVMSLIGAVFFVRKNASGGIGARYLGILALGFVFITILIGYPSLGANAGGLVTAVVTFGLALITLSDKRFSFLHGVFLVGLAVAILVAFAVIEILFSGNVSHFGRSVSLAKSYGVEYFGMLIGKKVNIHLNILKKPHVKYLALLSLPFFVMCSRASKSGRKFVSQVFPPAMTLVIISGSLVAFILNDSGTVPAVLMISIYIIVNLLLRLKESEQ